MAGWLKVGNCTCELKIMDTGLREKIKVAKSREEITTLLREGEAFEYASGKTRRAWGVTADKAERRLVKEQEAKVSEPVSKEKKKRNRIRK